METWEFIFNFFLSITGSREGRGISSDQGNRIRRYLLPRCRRRRRGSRDDKPHPRRRPKRGAVAGPPSDQRGRGDQRG